MADNFESRWTRIKKVINLEIPDRVPIAPMVAYFAGRYGGITAHEFMFDREKAERAQEKIFDDMGGWDAQILPVGHVSAEIFPSLFPIKVLMPGVELPKNTVHQFLEEEVMKPEDYDLALEIGWQTFDTLYMQRLNPNCTANRLKDAMLNAAKIMKEGIQRWKEREVPTLVTAFGSQPFNRFSAMRSFQPFVVDMYQRPEKMLKVMELYTDLVIQSCLKQIDFTGGNIVWVAGARDCGQFISLKQFERFSFPFIKRIVEEFAKRDIITLLHLDSDWTKNLPYFLELPKGKCLITLDGATDIFKAKEILEGHICIMGDVGAALLTLGSPREVEDYVKKLIDTVGVDGGFILSSGCEVPIDARLENFRAMIETGKTYGEY